ncbi:MAG TPA: transposase [Rhodopila sp.]
MMPNRVGSNLLEDQMAKTQCWQTIPTQLALTEFEQFVLPHLVRGSRGPAPKLSLYKVFNYVLKMLYLGCQWKELPIDKDDRGKPEVHYTRIYRSWRRWVDMGCMDAIFAGSVAKLHEDGRLDPTVIHGDATTTAAKKGATTSASAGTRRSRATRSSPSATVTAMSSPHS